MLLPLRFIFFAASLRPMPLIDAAFWLIFDAAAIAFRWRLPLHALRTTAAVAAAADFATPAAYAAMASNTLRRYDAEVPALCAMLICAAAADIADARRYVIIMRSLLAKDAAREMICH